MRTKGMALVLATGSVVVVAGRAGDARAGEAIEDNSFLVEEAYNQEPGVVQHINTMQIDRDGHWTYAFGQEWPVASQAHQLSFALPYDHAGMQAGFGDLQLNYRWQGVGVTGGRLAVAPRATLILPTGDEMRGAGALGTQVNLPISVELGGPFVAHSNVGATVLGAGDERDLSWDVFGGQSLIWLMHPKVNLMVEAVVTHGDDGSGAGAGTEVVLNPGLRFAIDVPGGLQIVPGLAAPVSRNLADDETAVGLYLYLSLEHSLAP